MNEQQAAIPRPSVLHAARLGGVSRREMSFLLLIVAAGAAFRTYHIGWLPLWYDELASAWMSRHSVSYLLTVLPGYETNPPLYYLLLKGWRALLGDSEAALRSLSALIGTATIPVVFAMGRMLGGKQSGGRIGLLAAAIFALSSLHVQYGQEARAYALLVFAVALAMACTMWLMLHTPQLCARSDQPEFENGGRWLPWVLGLMALGIALIMWAHDTGALAVLALVVPGVYWWVADARRSLRAFLRLAIAGGLALALFLPYLGYLLEHLTAVKSGFWIVPPSLAVVMETLTTVFGSASRSAMLCYLIFLCFGVHGVDALWRHGLRSVALLLVSVALLPVISELLISAVAMPVFLDRTLLYCNLPLYLAAAYGIAQVPVRGFVAGTILVGLLAADLGLYFKHARKEPWDQVAAYLSDSLQPGQPVLLLPAGIARALDYYPARPQNGELRLVGVPEDFGDEYLQSRQKRRAAAGTDISGMIDLDRISRLTRDSAKLAIVMRRVDLVDPRLLVQKEVSKTHVLTETKSLSEITVLLFEAREGHGRAPVR